jgi:hypothetical protein
LIQDDLLEDLDPPRGKQGPNGQSMTAVLLDALDCLETHRFATGHFERQLFHDARRWVVNRGVAGPFAFEFICGSLGLDPNAVRRGLRARAEGQCTGSIAEATTRGTTAHLKWQVPEPGSGSIACPPDHAGAAYNRSRTTTR